MEGRLITDNIIIANEIVHYLKGLRRHKVDYVALKIDIAKAHDKLECSYLEAMMNALGFCSRWVRLVMMCVSTVRFHIRVGDELVGPIVPERGLHQGDPISPYLFIIATEGLSALTRSKENRGLIHGCKITPQAPRVSHLFFSNDSYMFFQASSQKCAEVRGVLDCYKKASGQEVNFQKSTVLFSKNVEVLQKAELCDLLGVVKDDGNSKHLGMPIMVGKKKTVVFAILKEKLRA